MGSNAFGQPVRRREDVRLLKGLGTYTADFVKSGHAHAVMLRSPHAHADIVAIDTRAAAQSRGVLAIYTGEDWAASGLGGIPSGSDLVRFVGTPDDAGFRYRPSHPPLAHRRVRFVGDSVAIVIARSEHEARDAAELIAVDYDMRPAVTDTGAASAPGAPAVWDEAPDNVCFRWSTGDASAVDAAFALAAHVVTLEAINNRVHIGSLESRGAIGMFEEGRYTLRTGSQMPHALRTNLAKDALHTDPADVRVLIADVGGSFGIKNALYPEQILVVWAAQKLGRPVAWIGEQSDAFLSDYQARDNVSRGELALDAEGRFLALRVSTTAAIGAYLAPKGQLSPTSNVQALGGVYRIPAMHVDVTGVFTHTAPTEVYRGAGRPEAVYLLERLVDHAARALGIDPLTLRKRNLLAASDMPAKTALGLTYDSGDFPAMLDASLASAGFESFHERRAEARTRGMLRGFGIAHYCERVAGNWAENAWLEMRPNGKLTVLIGTMSNGQGHETAYAQLVASQLGIDADDVDVVQGDTDRIPSGMGTGGSASLAIGGAALAMAGHGLVEKALPLAADTLEAAPVDIVFEAGRFRISGTDRSIRLQDVAHRLGRDGAPDVLRGTGLFKPAGPTFPNGCHAAEVEIDPETGSWRLVSYTMLHDFGRVLNPMLLEGQLQGGVVQGIGQAAFEQVVHDPETGQVLTGSLMDYQLPRADDLPALVLEMLPTPSPNHPLGVKGCGEAGAAGAPPAVMNALLDALAPLGVRSLDMPATSEKIWRALRAAG
jgi:carbon-monoxide dehydrogenase large subunit